MTQGTPKRQDEESSLDWPASPWRRALLGTVAALLLLAAHALPHLV
ncbi:hypothetical protein P3G55_24600 [Leptospira sp. 96542]|nr:hypothetical protein [Leptospira sp. 96542]